MRRIGYIESQEPARRFGDYLFTKGMDNKVDDFEDGWAVWVENEDHLDAAIAEWKEFLQDGDHPKYAGAEDAAEEMRRQARRDAERWSKQHRDLRTTMALGAGDRPTITYVLIFLAILVGVATGLQLAHSNPVVFWLKFASIYFDGGGGVHGLHAEQILKGQVWRMFTPMFLHLGTFHLLFNMLWLYQLGGLIESRKGHRMILWLVLVIAGFSNTVQYLYAGPNFGGMSGVVFGLLGYIWIKMKFEPHEGLNIGSNLVTFMLIWLAICLLGIVGNIANGAHIGGLLMGMALGYLPHRWQAYRRRR